MRIERRLAELGLTLPALLRTPSPIELPFPWVRVHGDRAYVSGHGPVHADGSLAEPRGKVGTDVSTAEAQAAARLTALAMFASLQRELGDLDRVTAWLKVLGLVNVAPGFTDTPTVLNGFTDLVIEVWGPEAGRHARSAIGVAALPFDIPVEIEAEVAIR
jgi:enamine deaminase RidA (YjgF/YER057c/UK114 family)